MIEDFMVFVTHSGPRRFWPLYLICTVPDSLVDKASASGAGGRSFDSQCRRHWDSF